MKKELSARTIAVVFVVIIVIVGAVGVKMYMGSQPKELPPGSAKQAQADAGKSRFGTLRSAGAPGGGQPAGSAPGTAPISAPNAHN
jgi:hypothetical protein